MVHFNAFVNDDNRNWLFVSFAPDGIHPTYEDVMTHLYGVPHPFNQRVQQFEDDSEEDVYMSEDSLLSEEDVYMSEEEF